MTGFGFHVTALIDSLQCSEFLTTKREDLGSISGLDMRIFVERESVIVTSLQTLCY